ncbi:MAG: glycosyltransferase [Candidatus Yanofskybacteria bacterium]|nr:glycosyltransferase [Candidatus Yanofskybacteria bacterium]
MDYSKNIYLSVVLPIYNEEKSLPELMRELYSVCNSLNKEYEIIFVNDCSTDKTYDMLEELRSFVFQETSGIKPL